MVINASMRTDIPAFYSDWFFKRVWAGFCDVQNPYSKDTTSYWRYLLNSDVVNAFIFCTKNPLPLIRDDRFELFSRVYKQMWGMTINHYDYDTEKNTLTVENAISAFRELSDKVGKQAVYWRYDPIIYFGNTNNRSNHISTFAYIAQSLNGYTDKVVISFLDQYDKVCKNMPDGTPPSIYEQPVLVKALVQVANDCGMRLYTCHENKADFAECGAIMNRCQTIEEINKATGLNLHRPDQANARQGCSCVLNADIGAYNTCVHGCKYCYATKSHEKAYMNHANHDPNSSCIIGHVKDTDEVRTVKQFSWK